MGERLSTENDDTGRLTVAPTGAPECTAPALGDRMRIAERQARLDRVRAIARDIRANMRGPVTSDTSWPYDENGLPK
jgi:hypothetical protein